MDPEPGRDPPGFTALISNVVVAKCSAWQFLQKLSSACSRLVYIKKLLLSLQQTSIETIGTG